MIIMLTRFQLFVFVFDRPSIQPKYAVHFKTNSFIYNLMNFKENFLTHTYMYVWLSHYPTLFLAVTHINIIIS